MQFPALSVGSVYGSSGSVPASVAWTNALCHALVRYCDIDIGGQRIDRHYGLWLEIWNELTQTAEKQNGLRKSATFLKTDRKSNTLNTCGHCIKEKVCDSTGILYMPIPIASYNCVVIFTSIFNKMLNKNHKDHSYSDIFKLRETLFKIQSTT